MLLGYQVKIFWILLKVNVKERCQLSPRPKLNPSKISQEIIRHALTLKKSHNTQQSQDYLSMQPRNLHAGSKAPSEFTGGVESPSAALLVL